MVEDICSLSFWSSDKVTVLYVENLGKATFKIGAKVKSSKVLLKLNL